MERLNYQKLWTGRYERIRKYRHLMWQYLSRNDIEEEWIITRPHPSLWAMDEILRHMLASEIRYIHQSFDPDLPQLPHAVPAQWVGTVFFRLREDDHLPLDKLKEVFPPVENTTMRLLESSKQEDYGKIVRAPWGKEMKLYDLLEAFYDHENYHRGQIYSIVNQFRGVPKFEE